MSKKMKVSASGQHILHITVPKAFWGKVIGCQGATRQKIEEETRCNILIPRPKADKDIRIVGPSAEDVTSAAEKIDAIVAQARAKTFATHTVTFPAATDEIKANFAIFKQRVLKIHPGIDEIVFKYPNQLNFILARLSIMDERESDLAAKHFEGVKDVVSKILDGNELEVEIRGIFTEPDDPTEAVRVLAACESPMLEKITKAVDEYMDNLGFSKHYRKPKDPLLRMTVMKATYSLRMEKRRENFKFLKGCTLDATYILEELRDFNFGSLKFRSLHLSHVEHELGEPDDFLFSTAVIHFD